MTNDELAEAPLALLRALNERQAHDQVGATVMPGMPDAKAAGLEYGSREYENALEWLLHTGALVSDDDTNDSMRNVVGQPQQGWAFKLTDTGLELLHPPKPPPEQ